MASSNLERRRRIRALEAKRDTLIVARDKNKNQLAIVRTELKAARRG